MLADAPPVQIDSRRVIVDAGAASAVVTRNPVRISFRDGRGRRVLAQVRNRLPDPLTEPFTIDPEPGGVDLLPETTLYSPFSFTVGGELVVQNPGPGPFVGDTMLLSQKTIELAAEAANGVVGHVGLTVDAPIPEVKAFGERFQKRFKYKPDHNGLKGYTAVYAMKYVTEKKLGKLDRKALAKTLHGLTISPKDEPGILLETTWDEKGDIDRVSYVAEVVNGKQTITGELPKLGK